MEDWAERGGAGEISERLMMHMRLWRPMKWPEWLPPPAVEGLDRVTSPLYGELNKDKGVVIKYMPFHVRPTWSTCHSALAHPGKQPPPVLFPTGGCHGSWY